MRTYSELLTLSTFDERFEYLKLDSSVGVDTFGDDRYLNQQFYRSAEWKRIRDYVISRDLAQDMGLEGYEIFGKVIIHHLNPIDQNDILHSTSNLMDPEFLVCVSPNTHNAIHYGTVLTVNNRIVERKPNDTCPWRK